VGRHILLGITDMKTKLLTSHFRGFVWACLLAVLTLGASAQSPSYEARVFTNSQGQTMPYRILTPAHYQADKKYPLVVFFHGAGERGTDNEKQLVHGTALYLKPEVRERFPAFVIAPQCPDNQQWVDMPWGTDSGTRPDQPSASMSLALQILDAAEKEFSIDPARVYVTGLSMGGYATWDCITRFPDRFAAGVPICGGGDEKTITPAVAKVPVWAFHSQDDTAVKVCRTQNMIKALRAAGGHPNYFEYFGLGHNAWGTAYNEPEFLPWLFSQRLGKTDTYTLKTPAPVLPKAAQWPGDDMFPGKGPLQNADWFKNLWKQRRLEWYRNRDNDKGAVVFLGDSITHGWGSLAKDFPNLKVANRGISGDTTRGVLYRLQEDVLDLHPSAIVILIGTNDLGLGGNPADVEVNMQAILKAIKAFDRHIPIIWCRVMPRSIEAGKFPIKILEVNQRLYELTHGDPQVSLCDTWTIFANGDGGAKKEEFPDLLHPNAIGYAKWVAALNPILDKLALRGAAK
jgi:lysophospholipase L1-like esterase/poly(3-hydroxybutyrate) depolymerase